MRIKIHTTFLYLLLHTCLLQAQEASFQPDISRAYFHEKVDAAQKKLLSRDGLADSIIKIDGQPELSGQLTHQAVTHVDNLQKLIETDTAIAHNTKTSYLRGMADLLESFGSQLGAGKIGWKQLPLLMNAFDMALRYNLDGQSILPVVQKTTHQLGYMLVKNIAFTNNIGLAEAKEHVFMSHLAAHPKSIMAELGRNSDHASTDSLIRYAARHSPDEVFSYAQASRTPLGKKIASCPDSLVQAIVALSKSREGQLYLPFLDKLAKGQLQKEQIAEAQKIPRNYYGLLVQTAVDYARRMRQGDTPVAARALQTMLKSKSGELYVNVINGLHNSPNLVRFKSIQPLKPEELYHLIVHNEVEMYTSSYLYVYKRIFETLPVKSSDSLLQRVGYDRYKKFLTIASNYNTLDDFLAKMSAESATALMTGFVNNLEKGEDGQDIEDAVDVANAFAAIKNPAMKALMLEKVKENLAASQQSGNQKASIIYRLEKLVMESNDATRRINISDSLGILPVYDVANRYLQDSAGRIILQMFFYGDADGRKWYNNLLELYGNRSQWAMKSTPDWVQFTSIKTPVPFILFANKPLDENQDLDERAQNRLIDYMYENGYNPSITVHRGHSYYLKYTLEKMLPSKVVVLGSCGAYHNLSAVLKNSPDAYIISSKQVGQGAINVQLFQYLAEALKKGKDVNWATMMESLGKGIKNDGYDDYVFPHRNLGAIFIKAYTKAMEEAEWREIRKLED